MAQESDENHSVEFETSNEMARTTRIRARLEEVRIDPVLLRVLPIMAKIFHSNDLHEMHALAKSILPEMEEIMAKEQDRLMRANLPLTPKAAEALSWLSDSYLDGDEIHSKELAALFVSKDTLNRVTRQLLHLGFLEEAGTRPTGRRGRPPKAYRFHRWPSERLHQVFSDKQWSNTLLAEGVRKAVNGAPSRVWDFESFHVLEYHVDRIPFLIPFDHAFERMEAMREIDEEYGSEEAFEASFAQTLERAMHQADVLARLRGKDSLYALGTHFIRWTPAGPPSP